jgi:hypothetical protein
MSLSLPFQFLTGGYAENAKVGANFEAIKAFNASLPFGSVSSALQYQLAYYATAGTNVSGLTAITASRALVSDTHGLPVASTVTSTELSYLSGVSGALQNQLNGKLSLTGGTVTGLVNFTGDIAFPNLLGVVRTHNVKDYGAIGNNSHDDTTAFQNCLNALQTGERMYIPVGTYKITTGLTLSVNRIIIEGESPVESTINFVSPSNNSSLITGSGSLDTIIYRNLGISLANPAAHTGISGITHPTGDGVITFNTVYFSRFNRAGINLGNVHYVDVILCRFILCQDTTNTFLAQGFHSDGSNALKIEKCIFSENDQDIYEPGGTSVLIRNNTFEVGGDSGNILVTDTIEITSVNNLEFFNNYIEGNYNPTPGAVLKLNNCINARVHNNSFSGQDANIDKSDTFIQVLGSNSRNIVISANWFLEVKTYFVNTSVDVQLLDNYYYDGGVEKTSLTDIFSLLNGGTHIFFRRFASDTYSTSINGANLFDIDSSTITLNLPITTAMTGSRAVVTSAGSILTAATTTATEIGYVNGVTSSIQTQLNAKEPTVTKGNLTETTSSILTIGGGTNAVIGSGTTIAVTKADSTHGGYLSSTDWGTFNSKQTALTTNSLTASSPLSLSAAVTVIGAGAALTVATAASGTSGVMSATTQTLTGIKTFETQLIGKGTATNDSAASGYIGEYIESVIGSTSVPASGTYGEVTSITLTAGDWDLNATVEFFANSATITGADLEFLIGTAAGDNVTGGVEGSSYFQLIPPSGGTGYNYVSGAIPGLRKSIAGTTTYYLKVYPGTYSAGTPKVRGRISARRVR